MANDAKKPERTSTAPAVDAVQSSATMTTHKLAELIVHLYGETKPMLGDGMNGIASTSLTEAAKDVPASYAFTIRLLILKVRNDPLLLPDL